MSHKDDVERYVDGVLSGEIIAGRHVIAACKRYRLDLENAEEKGWFLDEETVSKQIDFMQALKHTKGAKWAGEPFVFSPSQKFIVWNILGFRMRQTETIAGGRTFHPRRFRQCYLTVARKYGKSTWVCVVVACLAMFDFPIEVQAEIYSAATKEDQAKRLTTQLADMLEAEPELASQCEFYKYKENINPIVLPDAPYNGSYIKAIGADGKTQDALNVHVEVRDEIHEWKKQQRKLWGKLETGSGSRPQPLSLITTTAGDDDSELWIQFDSYCTKVIESAVNGECIDDQVFAFIARLDESQPCECGGSDADCELCENGEIPGDDPFDESTWIKANPDIGTTPTWDSIRSKARKAKNEKAFEPDFKRYHCNIKVRSAQRVIHPNLWAKRAIKMEPWTGNCYGAWDVGVSDDLAGIAVVKNMPDGTRQGRAIGLCPEDGPRDLTAGKWPEWIERGYVIVTKGDTLIIEEMQEILEEWTEQFGVTEWAYDKRYSLQMAQNLEAKGIECVSFNQSYMEYNEPMRGFLRDLAQEKWFHDGNPFLAYCAANLARKERGGLWMPDKENSEDKIDPMVALIMADARAVFSPPPVESAYQRRGSLAV